MLEKASLFMEIYEVNKMFTEFMNKVNTRYKINYIQLLILIYSCEDKEMNVTALSQKLKLSRSAVSQALVCLQIKKLVTRVQSVGNRKVFYVNPTTKARNIVKEFSSYYEEFYEKLISVLGEENLNDLASSLNTFNNTLMELQIIGEDKC